jgi:hypothetical protein
MSTKLLIKLIGVVLAMALFTMATPSGVLAESEPPATVSLTLPSFVVLSASKPEVMLDVQTTDVFNTFSYQFNIEYDPRFVAPCGISTLGTMSENATVQINPGDKFMVAAYKLDGFKGSGTLIRLCFDMKGGIPALTETQIWLNNTLFNNDNPSARPVNTTQVVINPDVISGELHYGNATGAPIEGVKVYSTQGEQVTSSYTNASGQYAVDVDSVGTAKVSAADDGHSIRPFGHEVTPEDAGYILYMAVHPDQVGNIMQIAGDVNGDQLVTAYDAVLAARYVAGYEDEDAGKIDTWAFSPQSVTANVNSNTTYDHINFIGVIVGDVLGSDNGTAYPQGLANARVNIAAVAVGHTLTISSSAQVRGYKVVLDFDPACMTLANTSDADGRQIVTRARSDGLTVVAFGPEQKAVNLTEDFNLKGRCTVSVSEVQIGEEEVRSVNQQITLTNNLIFLPVISH